MNFYSCNSNWRRRLRSPNGHAFSLIEFIAVLTVIAILAAVLAPVLIRRIDQAARTRDAAELSGMADSLQKVILRTGQIPSTNTLVSALANELAVTSNKVALGVRGVPRLFLSDPNLWIGSGNNLLPFTQSSFPLGTGTNIGGVDVPGRNLRLMIISSLVLPLTNNIVFDTVWATPDGAVPSGWTWAGRTDDLRIQRVDLAPLFNRVILNPIDTNKYGSFAIESGPSVSTTNSVTNILANSWYLKSTAIRLFNTNNNPATYTLETKPVVQGDFSYVFEGLAWRGLFSGRATPPSSSDSTAYSESFTQFMALATPFTNSPSGPSAPSGATTLEVLRCFFSIMVGYNFWYQENFAMGSRTANTFLNQNETITSGTLADIIKN